MHKQKKKIRMGVILIALFITAVILPGCGGE